MPSVTLHTTYSGYADQVRDLAYLERKGDAVLFVDWARNETVHAAFCSDPESFRGLKV